MIKTREDHCLFCRHYITASGNCKGQNIEPCGYYIDVDSITLCDLVKRFINNIFRRIY